MQRLWPVLLLCACLGPAAAAETDTAAGGRASAGTPIAQDARRLLEEPVQVRTAGHGTFQGRLMAVLDDRLEILTADGEIIQVALAEVETIVAAGDADGRDLFYQDAAANRLVVMPTGFPMEQGELHVTSQEIVAVTSSYGLTEHISLWGGVSIPGLVVSGRFSFMPADRVGLSVGSFVGAEWFELTTLVLPYALASFGSPNRNITVGGGGFVGFFGMAADDPLAGGVLAFGGKTTITPTAALVTETWAIWLPRWETVFIAPSVVFRIAGARLSWDIGAVTPLELEWADGPLRFGGVFDGTVVPIPILSVTYRID